MTISYLVAQYAIAASQSFVSKHLPGWRVRVSVFRCEMTADTVVRVTLDGIAREAIRVIPDDAMFRATESIVTLYAEAALAAGFDILRAVHEAVTLVADLE